MLEQGQFSLIQVVVRHWKFGIGCIVGFIGLAGLVTLILPRRYESEMKFLVNNVRADLLITPDKNQPTAPPAEVTETQVNSEMELLRSHDILEDIVLSHRLSLCFLSNKSAQPSRKSVERACIRLQRALTIRALRKSDVIDVTYRDSDPDLTVSVLRDLGDRYLTCHLAVHSVPGTEAFFADQVQKFNLKLAEARTALALFHQQRHLFSMPQQQAALVDRLDTVSSQLKDVEAQIQAHQARLGEIARQRSVTPERVVTQVKETADQLALQQLEPLLAQLENHRIELATKYEPAERFVVELDQEIANTRREIARIRAQRINEQTTDLNTLHQSMNSEYVRGQIELKELQTQRVELAAMLQSYFQELDELDQSYIQLQDLEQHETEAKDNFLLYTHRLDEARLAKALDRDKFSNVAMIEQPVASPIPVFPKIGLNLGIGAVLGLLFFLAIAFFRETREDFSTSEGSRDEVLPTRSFHVVSGD